MVSFLQSVMHELSVVRRLSKTMGTEEDLKYATKFVKPHLAIVGAWPIPATSSNLLKLMQRIEHVITYTLFFLLLVPSILFLLFKEKSGKVKLKVMPPLINSTVQCFKYTILLCRTKELGIGLGMIRRDWLNASNENRLIFLSKAKITKRLVLIVAITMYGGGVCYRAILPLLRGTIVTPDNVTIRPLPCASYFYVINEQISPYYEAVFTVQILAGFVTYAIISGSCGICALLVLHTCCMLKILAKKMMRLVDDDDLKEDMVHRRLMDIVEYQSEIRQFLKNIETAMQYICMIELLGGTSLICIGAYSFFMEWENGNTTACIVILTLQLSCTFSVFILCYIGQFLVNENSYVSETCRTLNWYRLPNQHARGLILIIAISNSPIKLTAGKVLEMSLTTFTDVMKVSMAYMNILREVV